MKRQVLFLQGGGEGAHREDAALAAYLRNTLGPGYEVRYPKMPDEENPDYQKWKVRIRKELAALDSKAILIGHSLGGAFLLKYISEAALNGPVAGLFLIAAPFWGGDGWRYPGYEEIELPEDVPRKLPDKTPIIFYHSRDDEFVPFIHASLYAKKFPQATIRAFNNRGHQFNNDLSEIVADIENLFTK